MSPGAKEGQRGRTEIDGESLNVRRLRRVCGPESITLGVSRKESGRNSSGWEPRGERKRPRSGGGGPDRRWET